MKENQQRKQFYKYAAINFAFFITMTFGGYVTVFLQSIGFNPQQVGRIAALNSGIGIFSSPFWGMLSDKLRSLKKVIIATLAIGGVLFALIPWVSGFNIAGVSILFLLIPLTMFFRMPVMSLIDNWMLRNCRKEELNYGALRAYGALSFAIVALALGTVIVPRTGPAFIFYISLIFTIPPLLLIIFVKGSTDDQGVDKKRLTFKKMQIGQLFKNYYLVTYILFTVVQRIPFQSAMIFLPFLIYDVGGNIEQLGIIMGIKALVEIPLMMLLKRLRKKFPLYVLIIVATGFFVLECVLLSFAASFNIVVVISVLHGIGNGLMIPSGSSYVFFLAPEHLKATAQTVLASMTAIAGILGGLVGGMLISLLDIQQFYFIIGIMLAVALGLFILSFFIGEKLLGIKRPGLSLI
ncbi:MAG: MFS transporter [Firmicutes bacterium]|nr:MFS transporter [Bacillota bacterium]